MIKCLSTQIIIMTKKEDHLNGIGGEEKKGDSSSNWCDREIRAHALPLTLLFESIDNG